VDPGERGRRALPGAKPSVLVLTISATWTLTEAARSRWPLGGYEWGQLGYLTHDLPLRSAAGLMSTSGLTALLVGACAAVVVLLDQLCCQLLINRVDRRTYRADH
jgi:apolipoprotein N-acyltransferase